MTDRERSSRWRNDKWSECSSTSHLEYRKWNGNCQHRPIVKLMLYFRLVFLLWLPVMEALRGWFDWGLSGRGENCNSKSIRFRQKPHLSPKSHSIEANTNPPTSSHCSLRNYNSSRQKSFSSPTWTTITIQIHRDSAIVDCRRFGYNFSEQKTWKICWGIQQSCRLSASRLRPRRQFHIFFFVLISIVIIFGRYPCRSSDLVSRCTLPTTASCLDKNWNKTH